MKNTLLNFRELISNGTDSLSLDELSSQYKESFSPALFATAFVRMYKYALKAGNKYPMIDADDLLSYSLEKMDTCLLTYDETSDASITTYYSQLVYNRLREAAQSMNTHKRKIMFNCTSYDKLVEEGFELPGEDTEYIDLEHTLTMFDLSEKEMAYCMMAAQDYPNKLIAEKLKVSVMTVSNIRKKLKNIIDERALIMA